MMCKECGADVVEEAAFCHVCGANLKGSAGSQAAAPRESAADPRPSGKDQFAQRLNAGADAEDEEELLWRGSFSKLAMVGAWIAAGGFSIVLVVIGAVFNFSQTAWLTACAAIGVVWLFLLLRLLYRQLSISYTLTSQRLIHEHGLLWRRTDRIEAIDIDDVTFDQGPIERMMGVGTVKITSSDQTTPEFSLVGIEDVRRIATLVDEVRRKERRKRGLHIETV